MCGIIGNIEFGSSIVDKELFEKTLEKLRHRGPDGRGSFMQILNFNSTAKIERSIQFGHRRLSIFDRTIAGKQPMADKKGRQIIYNGEIFNWPELKDQLKKIGYIFNTNTDTEVILSCYDYWGRDCVNHFNGFWAFAIFDPYSYPNNPVVFFSRDRFGIKPFYYIYKKEQFLFCSEISPIYYLLGEKPTLNKEQLARYLIFDLSHDNEKTIYKNIFELEPGCNAELNLVNGYFNTFRYWSLPEEPDLNLSDKAALDTFSEILEDAVRIRFRADREVALTLSGGTDSSAIAVAASRVYKNSVRAFTSHFPNNPEIDESYYASLVVKLCGFEHELVQPDLQDIDKNERDLSKHQELLYVSFSMLVNWAVQKEIKKRDIVVTLTGQGGDELFLGYERYFVPRIISDLRNPVTFFRELYGAGRNSRLGISGVLLFLLYFLGSKIRTKRYLKEAKLIFRNNLINSISENAQIYPINRRELQFQQICGEQLRRLLRYDDRTSSFFGMENRPVMLDFRLVEFAYRLPWHHKIRNGWTKHIVRRYLDEAGLPQIAWRKHKLGYNAPTDQWANLLLEIRGASIFESPFAKSILKADSSIEKLGKRNRFKVLNLLSTAELLNWQPL